MSDLLLVIVSGTSFLLAVAVSVVLAVLAFDMGCILRGALSLGVMSFATLAMMAMFGLKQAKWVLRPVATWRA